MLRNLNISVNGKRDSSDPRVGVLASEIPSGFPLESFLLNDIDVNALGRLYSLEILTFPSEGELRLNKAGVGDFSGAAAGTYTGSQRVDKYDPGVGRVSSVLGSYSIQVLAPIQNDTQAPIIPGAIVVSALTTSGFTFSWSAATDNVGVTGYEISIDTGTALYVDAGDVLSRLAANLLPATQYTVRVRAYDEAGNKSTALTTQVTTAIPADEAAPVFSGLLVVSGITATGFTATWPAATDNIGVVSYEFSVDTGDASYVNVGAARTRLVTALFPGTLYNIRVRAVDAAGNVSAPLTATMTTAGVAPVGSASTVIQKLSDAPVIYQLSPLSSAPVQITFRAGIGQEIVLFNNGTANAIVTLKGSAAGAVTTKGLAGVTVDLSGGLPITVPQKEFVTLKLENAVLYLRGDVTLTANTTSTVFAGILL